MREIILCNSCRTLKISCIFLSFAQGASILGFFGQLGWNIALKKQIHSVLDSLRYQLTVTYLNVYVKFYILRVKPTILGIISHGPLTVLTLEQENSVDGCWFCYLYNLSWSICAHLCTELFAQSCSAGFLAVCRFQLFPSSATKSLIDSVHFEVKV